LDIRRNTTSTKYHQVQLCWHREKDHKNRWNSIAR